MACIRTSGPLAGLRPWLPWERTPGCWLTDSKLLTVPGVASVQPWLVFQMGMFSLVSGVLVGLLVLPAALEHSKQKAFPCEEVVVSGSGQALGLFTRQKKSFSLVLWKTLIRKKLLSAARERWSIVKKNLLPQLNGTTFFILDLFPALIHPFNKHQFCISELQENLEQPT